MVPAEPGRVRVRPVRKPCKVTTCRVFVLYADNQHTQPKNTYYHLILNLVLNTVFL
jgi:hypothetical protein